MLKMGSLSHGKPFIKEVLMKKYCYFVTESPHWFDVAIQLEKENIAKPMLYSNLMTGILRMPVITLVNLL